MSCDELPMYNFIKLNVFGDAKWLIKSGNPDTEDALEAIQSEYAELSGDTSTNSLLKASIQYTYLTNKMAIFNDIVSFLRIRSNTDLIAELVSMGFNFKFTDLETDLSRCELQSKQWIIKINHAKQILESRPKQEATTEKAWYDSLQAIAQQRGIASINPRLISVIEYIVMEQAFTQHINMLKSHQNGR